MIKKEKLKVAVKLIEWVKIALLFLHVCDVSVYDFIKPFFFLELYIRLY